ncbi:MAG: outer membrane beta-barrel protein [Chitinophagaceae bacterium]
MVLLLIVATGTAQKHATANVTGKVLTIDKHAVENATVTLLSAADSTMVRTVFPEKSGVFSFQDVKPGQYLIRVTQVGFTTLLSKPFSVSEESELIAIEPFVMSLNIATMDEVRVESKKPFVEKKLDRIIVNVENSIVSAGSSVLDVLERAPGVVVNQESSINLQGKQGVVVMIDGKPTPLSGSDLITYLKGIPSSNIAAIEIITQPSARYDAAGNAGIINIKFKKDQRQGLNGSLTASYGQGRYHKPSASTTINYRRKSWNLFGSLSYIRPLNFTRFYINRKFFDTDRSLLSIFDQTSYIRQPIASQNARFGVDYYVGKKTIIGLLFNLNQNNNSRDGSTNSIITQPSGELDYNTRTSIGMKERRFNGFANINLKHVFDSTGTELSADIDYGEFSAKTFQDVMSSDFDKNNSVLRSSELETDQRGTITVRSAKADFVKSNIGNGKLEAGAKFSLVRSDNDVKFFDIVDDVPILDNSRSNHFIYDENVNAAYTSFSRELKKIDFQIGLRMEQTVTRGRQLSTGESFSRNYVNLFPSISFNQKISPIHQLSFSYARRIDRPSYRQLNPFKIFVDPYTYVEGDPSLKPVFTNVYEFTHNYKGGIMTTLSYSSTRDVITDVFVQDDVTKISYQTPANLQRFQIWNLRMFAPLSLGKWLKSNLTGNIYWNKYESPLQGGNLMNDYTSWDIRLHNSITIGKKGWSAELNGYYQAKNAWGLFIIRNLSQISTGIQKLSKNKNSTFRLNMTDIFYTNRIAVIVKYQNMDFFTDRTWDSRVVSLSFTHRFGSNSIARARLRNSGVEDIKQRAN